VDLETNGREMLLEPGNERWDQVGINSGQGANDKAAPLASLQLPHDLGGLFHFPQHPLGVLLEQFAGLSENHLSPQPVEEARAKFGFQGANLDRECRLGDVHGFSRSSEILYRCNGEEVPELAKFHRILFIS
jgi:hypothetical protein